MAARHQDGKKADAVQFEALLRDDGIDSRAHEHLHTRKAFGHRRVDD